MEFDQVLGKAISTMLLTGGMLLVMASPLIFIAVITKVHSWVGRRRRAHR